MKYNVGDRVYIKDDITEGYGKAMYKRTRSMLKGERVTIKKVNSGKDEHYKIEGGTEYGYHDEMIDHDITARGENAKHITPDNLAVGDVVYIRDDLISGENYYSRDTCIRYKGMGSGFMEIKEFYSKERFNTADCDGFSFEMIDREKTNNTTQPTKREPKLYIPKKGDTYRYLSSTGDVMSDVKTDGASTDEYLIGNAYETKEIADAVSELVKDVWSYGNLGLDVAINGDCDLCVKSHGSREILSTQRNFITNRSIYMYKDATKVERDRRDDLIETVLDLLGYLPI